MIRQQSKLMTILQIYKRFSYKMLSYIGDKDDWKEKQISVKR